MIKRFFVSGGCGGIGKAIVFQAGRSNGFVSFSYNNSKKLAKQICEELVSEGIEVNAIQADLSIISERITLCNRINDLNINVLVNNAAYSKNINFLKIDPVELDQALEVNLKAPFALAQSILPKMLASGWGRIINIGSIGGQQGGEFQIHYAVSKGALETLTKSLAKITFGSQISSFCISPGPIRTEMLRSIVPSLKDIESKIPVGRLGEPEEIAKVVLALCENEWEYSSGNTFNFNGGVLLS